MTLPIDRQWLPLGKLGKPKGLGGEIYFDAYNPDSDTLTKISNVRVNSKSLHVATVTENQKRKIVRFEEIDSVEQAKSLTGAELWVARNEMPALPRGQFYVEDLIGFKVCSGDKKLGVLKGIIKTASNDIYVVDGKEEILLPIIPGVLEKIDVENEVIWVNPPEVVDAI